MSTQKPEPLARVRARKLRQQAQARRRCTDAVWARDGSLCRDCGVWVHRENADWRRVGHVHEIVLRSRGGDPSDPENAKLLCPVCHAKAHGLRVSA